MIRKSPRLLVTRDGFCWVATTNSLLLYKDPTAAADEVMVIEASGAYHFPGRRP